MSLLPKFSDADKAKEIVSICDDAFAYANEYYDAFAVPLKMQFLAQRYNRRAKKTGRSLVDILKSDPRFIVQISLNGGYMVITNDSPPPASGV